MTPARDAIQTYLRRMAEIRSTGGATSETSYYSALENLLNELGTLLDPEVICNGQLRNQGAGHPDFGLYSKKQCSKGAPKPGQGEVPERGVVEVKPLSDNSWQTAHGKQATKYFDHYKLVLITNYREFRLIGEDETGKPIDDAFAAAGPWYHALAIIYSPQYLADNADGIAVDWPRIPLPSQKVLFNNSVSLVPQYRASSTQRTKLLALPKGPLKSISE